MSSSFRFLVLGFVHSGVDGGSEKDSDTAFGEKTMAEGGEEEATDVSTSKGMGAGGGKSSVAQVELMSSLFAFLVKGSSVGASNTEVSFGPSTIAETLKGTCFFGVVVRLSGISSEESHAVYGDGERAWFTRLSGVFSEESDVVSGDEEKACFAQLSGVLSEKSHVVTGDSEEACVTRLGRGATRFRTGVTGMLEGRRLDLERTRGLRAESE